MYFAFGWRHLAGSFSFRVLWNKAVTHKVFLTGVRLDLVAAKSGKENTEPWFQKYKLGNGIAFSSCQQMGTEMGEIVICEGKWHFHWSWLIWCVSWFIFPVHWRSSVDTHTLTAVPKAFTGAVYATAASSAREISLLVANIIFYLADVHAGSLVLLTFASPAAPTPDGAPSPAVAWLTHFLPHLLPNDCWAPFPNSGPAHLCDCLLSLLQWQRVQWLIFENVAATNLWNCGAGFCYLHQKEGMSTREKISHWGHCEEFQLRDSTGWSWCQGLLVPHCVLS